tara:strand:- start:1566 stop:2180 length:615 start_codon:yes stop_codon:yes gene_type:complete
MKTLAYLHMSQHVDPNNSTMTNGEERVQQYLNGLGKFFQYPDLQKLDVFITDNTITEDRPLDKRLQNLISSHECKIVLCDNNQGKQNKGTGVLEQWRYCRDTMLEYDWIIHFEPRQLLISFDFFDSFFQDPRNLFNKREGHFWTGLFAVSSSVLVNFISNCSLGRSESIEYILYDYIKDKYNFDTVDKLNLLWNDAYKKIWINI